ncbi:gp53-like domain-containing protein [Mitsuokella jalaludinii]|uniref:gp53-like domain-containing protein n=1 Tax=Mitsuokella jalaludinii TaxID=187979 RepID=UPI003078E2A0
MQKYREINGNDYVKDSRVTINETMQSIQSMNSGTAFPTTNLFEGMKCYRTDLKKTYTLTDVENGTWVEDAHATLADTATKLQTPRALSLTGKAAGSATFDGSSNASINVTSVNADTASKLSTARKINITGNASGSAAFDGTSDVNINTTVNESKHAATANTATKVNATAPNGGTADLAFGTMAVNNFARVRVGGSDDNGWLEIATADGGNEPIYVRQYGGAHGWSNGRPETVTNEAVLLDGSGNTKFPHNVTATNFVGHLTGNADSATNADKVDGIHAASMFYHKGIWDANNWATIGTYQVDNNPPVSDAYGWGQVISSSTTDGRFQLYASDNYGGNGRLYYRTGWDGRKNSWNTILDSENYNSFAPTKTGGGASGTWGINISGNAASATTAGNVSEKIYYSADSPSVATDKLFTVKQAHGGEDNVPNNGLVIQTGPTGANYNGKLYITDNGGDGVWIGGVAAGKEVGWTRLVENKGTWNISILGNADKVDGYHASDIINKISAANTGGIVAASLTENGYVKFANGLILQWGYAGAKNYVTFPIAFSSFARVVCTCDNGNWAWNTDLSKTGFSFIADGSGCWIAVGV